MFGFNIEAEFLGNIGQERTPIGVTRTARNTGTDEDGG
jgi:hypothetical protein